MTQLYLVRHGETEANAKQLYCGMSDLTLTETGINQAKAVAQLLKQIIFERVITSELIRTQTTANIIRPNAICEILGGLNEINLGDFELQFHADLAHTQAYKAWCNDWIHATPPNGESFLDFRTRVLNCFTKHILLADQTTDKKILVVAHQGVLRVLMGCLLKLPLESFWNFHFIQGSYSVIRLDFEDQSDPFHCTIESINQKGTP